LVALIAAYYDTRGELRVQATKIIGLMDSDKAQLDLNVRQLETNKQVVTELSKIRTDISVIRERIEKANLQAAENATKITEAIDAKDKPKA
jgi:hypothetical protein